MVQVFLGYQAGQIIMTYKGHKARIIRFLVWGLATGLIGFGLNGTTRDEGLIPINKNLWYVASKIYRLFPIKWLFIYQPFLLRSLSFVFVTTGLAFILMALTYLLVDYKRIWQGEPFLFAGKIYFYA